MKIMDIEKLMDAETMEENNKTKKVSAYHVRKSQNRRAAVARVHKEATAGGYETDWYCCESGYELLMPADEAAWNHEQTIQRKEEVRRLDDLSNWSDDPYFSSLENEDGDYWVNYRNDDYDEDDDIDDYDEDDVDVDPFILHRYHFCDDEY